MLANYLFGEVYFKKPNNQKVDQRKGLIFSPIENKSISIVEDLLGDIDTEESSPIVEAELFKKLLCEGSSVNEIAEKVRKSSVYVRNKLRLLELPEQTHFLLNTGLITEGKALVLLELRCVFQNTDFFDSEAYKSIGVDINDWCSLFQTLIAWKYYRLSKEEIQRIIDRLKYVMLKATWSIINGNKLADKGVTVGYLRRYMGIKTRELRDEEILWLFKYHRSNVDKEWTNKKATE